MTCSKLPWTLTHADSSSILGDTCDNGDARDSNPAKASIQSSSHLGSCRCRPFADHPPPARRATCFDASRSPGDIRVMPGGNATSRQSNKEA